MKLQNKNPTRTEKLLFKYYGLYLIHSTSDFIKYVPIHVNEYSKKNFPQTIAFLDEKQIEWESSVEFNNLSETVSIKCDLDIDGVLLIAERMKELGYRVVL